MSDFFGDCLTTIDEKPSTNRKLLLKGSQNFLQFNLFKFI